MVRGLFKTFSLTLLIIGGSVALYFYQYQSSAEHQMAQLQQQNHELEQLVNRIETDRRVAKILVTDQQTVNGALKTTLLFVEYAADGSALPAREFTINGDEAHFDAEIIKFKDELIKANDPLRNHSILLFVRVYGSDQAPDAGYPIDVPGTVPEIYRGADPAVAKFEQELWSEFWTLYNDKSKREAKGIRGMHGEGLYGKFDMDHIYTITVRADGGTINEEPIEAIYRDAMRRHPQRTLGIPMRIKVNGQDRDVADAMTINALLSEHKLTPDKVAVELNRRLVRAAKYDTFLKAGDEIEIVTFVGGG